MSGLTKKSGKTKSRKPTRRPTASAPAAETPVLFRLPDLSISPDTPLSAANVHLALESHSMVVGATAPSMALPAAEAAVPSAKTKSTRQPLLLISKYAKPTLRVAAFTARQVSRVPYLAPAGLLCASLLVTLGVLYNPFDHEPSAAPVAMNETEASEPTPHEHAAVEADSTKAKAAAPVARENLHLKKIANQLDEQLLAQDRTEKKLAADASEEVPDEAVDDNIAAATENAIAMDDEPLEPETSSDSFTEPWSRKKPSRNVEVARHEMEAEEEWTEEEKPRQAMRADRTATRTRSTYDREEDRTKEIEEDLLTEDVPPPKRQRTSRYADFEDLESSAKSKSARGEEELDVYDAAEPEETAPESPWNRIRNERLQREPHRDEPLTKSAAPTSSKKPQYRSPPGQDIELDSELLGERVSRPRAPSKRSASR